MSAKPKKLNAAVIGLNMGRTHVAGFQGCPRSAVVALCDIDADRLRTVAKNAGIPPERCYADYRALLADAGKLGLHAASVALPNHLHAPVTLDCFRAGLHVLCEKPMAMDAGAARAMLAAARKARRTLMINFSYRFTDQSQALKRYVETGALGDIYFGRTVWHRRRGLPGPGSWFGIQRLSGGGPIIDLGVHRLDLALWLMGHPRPVAVSGAAYGAIAPALARRQGKVYDVEDLGAAMIRFDTGATLILEASWAEFGEKAEDMCTQLYGTRGGLIQRNVSGEFKYEALVFGETGKTLWEQRLQQPLVPTPTAQAEFADAVLDGREPLTPGEHGLAVQVILDAIYQSAATGREVVLAKSRKG